MAFDATTPNPADGAGPTSTDDARVIAVRDAYQKLISDTAPTLSVEREKVIAAWTDVNHRAQKLRDTGATSVVLTKSSGVHLTKTTWARRVALAATGAVIVVSEVALAFNGVRYARGELGQINSPFDDPVSLIATVGFVGAGVKLAAVAAAELRQAERSTLNEPEVPVEVTDPAVPETITDPDGGRLIPDHPLNDNRNQQEAA